MSKDWSGFAFPKVKAKKRVRKVGQVLEVDIQKQVENYLRIRGIRFIHIPEVLQNFLRWQAPVQIAKLASEAFKGVPDILAFKSTNKIGLNCLALEIKRECGKLSQGQKNWHKGLNVQVCYGWDECKDIIDRWMNED